eukprot:jgi/Psemu1/313613/fgenesh1_kg.1246_\
MLAHTSLLTQSPRSPRRKLHCIGQPWQSIRFDSIRFEWNGIRTGRVFILGIC